MNKGTKNKLKDIIVNNDVAFVIGNGINQYFFNDVKSWTDLLKSLWIKHYHDESNGITWNKFIDEKTNTLNGLSNTELFDLIELKCYYRTLSNNFQELQGRFPSIDFKLIDSIARNKSTFDLINIPEQHSNLLQELRQKIDESTMICRDWCQNNIENANTLSDLDCTTKTLEFLSNNTKVQLYKNQLKKEIASEYENTKFSSDLSSFMKIIEEKNAPVLTTNFDTYMSSSIDLNLYKMGKGFTDYYPWNMYWGRAGKLALPTSGFGIWHINGLKNYHRSIRLGLSDYMGSVSRARTMIHYKSINDFFDGKNIDNWEGSKTWLHVVFNKPLFIFGLSLDENEVFLRWLLIQRAKYSKMFERNLIGWYIDKNISNGKQAFLEALGFTVIRADYDDLYNAF